MTTTLLAVDDSKTMRRVLEITFSGEEEFRTLLAASAQEALEKLRSEHPAVVLIDANLGERSGYDLCQEMKREAPGVGVILLSSKQQPYDRARGTAVGTDDYIDKPFDTQLLLDKVVALTQNKAAAQPIRLVAAAPVAPGPAAAAAPAAERPRPGPPAFNATIPGVARPAVPGRPAAAPAPAAPAVPVAPPGPRPVFPVQPGSPPVRTLISPPTAGAPGRPHPDQAELPVVEASVPKPAAPSAPEPVAPPAPAPAAPAPVAAPSPVAPAAPPAAVVASAADAMLAPRLQELGLTQEQAAAVLSLSRDVVEKVVWEVVPILAETMIREEIRRLTTD